MNEKISDERLRYWETVLAENATYNGVYLAKTGEEARELRDCIVELITLRSLNKRLVEDANWLHQSLCAYLDYADDLLRGKCYDPLGAIEAHTALMKELEEK